MTLTSSRPLRPGTGPGTLPWRRTLLTLAGVTSVAAVVGSVQLVTGTFTPPVADLEPLGLDSWVLPGLWLAASVAVPCGTAAVLAWRRSRRYGAASAVAGVLLLVELLAQIPFVGQDPLQAVMAYVGLLLVALGYDAGRRLRPAAAD